MGGKQTHRSFLLALAVCVCAATANAQGKSPEGAERFQLSSDKQKAIWDAEHITFKIETHVGKPLTAALLAGDVERLRRFFREDAEGRVLTGKSAVRRSGIVTESARQAEQGRTAPADAAGVVDALFALATPVRSDGEARLRVLRIEPVDPDAGVWATRLFLDVRGKGADGGPREVVAEYDADFVFEDPREITPDARIVSRFEVVSEVTRASPRPLMKEVTRATGLADVPLLDNWTLPPKETRELRHQVAVEDFDRDGYLDIAVATLEGLPLLLRSVEGRRFTNVASELGILRSRSYPKKLMRNALVAWIDYDADGFPDLVLGERVYHNEGGRAFTDVTEKSGIYFDRVPLGPAVADYDGDGRVDLYISYLKSFRPRPPGFRPWVGDVDSGADNILWKNLGDGRFRNVTSAANAGGGRKQTFASAFFHLDDDVHPDLYIANDFGKNVLLHNRGDGTFRAVTDETGVGDYSTSMGVSAGDLDNDGKPEIYVANMFSKMGRRIITQVSDADYPEGVYEQIRGSCAGNRLYRTDGGERYREVGSEIGVSEVGWAYAPAMVDFDADGLLDLYATTGFMSYERGKPDG